MKSSRERSVRAVVVACVLGVGVGVTEVGFAKGEAANPPAMPEQGMTGGHPDGSGTMGGKKACGPGMRQGHCRHGMMGGQGPGMMGGQQGPGMMGGQQGPGMMGGQQGPGMMGGQGPGMMGGQGSARMAHRGAGMMGHQGAGQMGGRSGRGMMHRMDPVMLGHNAAMAERTLLALKRQLTITKAQEAAWKAYVEAAMSMALAHGGVVDIMHGRYDTALAAAEARTQFMVQLIDKGKHVLAAFKTLYTALSDEQKTHVNRFFGASAG